MTRRYAVDEPVCRIERLYLLREFAASREEEKKWRGPAIIGELWAILAIAIGSDRISLETRAINNSQNQIEPHFGVVSYWPPSNSGNARAIQLNGVNPIHLA